MSTLNELRGLRRRGAQPSKRDNKAAFWFLLPWFAGLLFITAGPIAASLGLGFTEYNLIQPPKFIGLGNFTRIFTDERLHNALRVTFTYVLVSVPLQLACALGVAMLLDRGMRGLAFYRSAFYLPSLLGSSVAIAVLWRQIFGTEGLVNRLLALVGITGQGGSPTRAPRCPP